MQGVGGGVYGVSQDSQSPWGQWDLAARPGDGVCRVYGVCPSDQGMVGLWGSMGLSGHPGDGAEWGQPGLARGCHIEMVSGGCQDTQGTVCYGVCWDMGALGAARTPGDMAGPWGQPGHCGATPQPATQQDASPITPPAPGVGSSTPFLQAAGGWRVPFPQPGLSEVCVCTPKMGAWPGPGLPPAGLQVFTPGPPESRLRPLPGAGFHRPFHNKRGGGGTQDPAHAVPIRGAGEPTDVSNYCPIWRLPGPCQLLGSAAKEQPQHCSSLYNSPDPREPGDAARAVPRMKYSPHPAVPGPKSAGRARPQPRAAGCAHPEPCEPPPSPLAQRPRASPGDGAGSPRAQCWG